MPIISPTLPNDGETIDAQDVNGPFNAILGVLNGNIDDQNVKPGSLPWSVMDSFSNQIPASAMQDSGNLENFRADAKISFIPSGLIWSATTGLAAGMTSGEYYSNSGILLPITAITSRTFTASRDTYVSIAQNGSIAYSEVTNGAAQPSLPSNSNWLAKVVTNGSAVTGVTDMRQTAPIASHNVDFANMSVASPLTSGAWKDFIPTWTNLSVGNGTLRARYYQIGKIVTVEVFLLFGSTTSITGSVRMTLPVAMPASVAAFNWRRIGMCQLVDEGSAVYSGAISSQLSSTEIQFFAENASGTYVSPGSAINATTPHTWANTDKISFIITYEAA